MIAPVLRTQKSSETGRNSKEEEDTGTKALTIIREWYLRDFRELVKVVGVFREHDKVYKGPVPI